MSMRRPKASDRNLAEFIYALKPGNYRIEVTDLTTSGRLVYPKREGSLVIDDTWKRIEIRGV